MNDRKKRMLYIESVAFTLYLSAKEVRKEIEAESQKIVKARAKLFIIKGGKKD